VRDQDYCDHCGAKLEATRVRLNKTLAQTLIKLRRLEVELGKPHIWLDHDDVHSEHRLTRSQRNNMTRLRWLGLARYTESHSSIWFITSKGYKFLRGESVKSEVWTFRNKIMEDRRSEAETTMADVFRKDGQPYFEPVTDRAPVTIADQKVAVEQRHPMGTQKCAYKFCDETHKVELKFGQPIPDWYCEPAHRELERKRR